MVVNCQLMSNFLWHFLTKIWKLKFEIEFGISICNASRHHTCNSNAHRDETNLIQTYRIKVSIVDSAFWIIQSEHTRRNLLRELISSFKIKYLNQKKIHLHLCAYLDFEHCTNERPQATTIYLYIGIAQKVYAQ